MFFLPETCIVYCIPTFQNPVHFLIVPLFTKHGSDRNDHAVAIRLCIMRSSIWEKVRQRCHYLSVYRHNVSIWSGGPLKTTLFPFFGPFGWKSLFFCSHMYLLSPCPRRTLFPTARCVKSEYRGGKMRIHKGKRIL